MHYFKFTVGSSLRNVLRLSQSPEGGVTADLCECCVNGDAKVIVERIEGSSGMVNQVLHWLSVLRVMDANTRSNGESVARLEPMVVKMPGGTK